MREGNWKNDEGPSANRVIDFRRGDLQQVRRVPRLQNLSDTQIDQLLRLLRMTDSLEAMLERVERVMTGCPVARLIDGK